MIILKQVIHYPDTNSVEATWVDREITPAIGVEGEEGYVAETIKETQVKCHSYSDRQMDILRADLGADAADYADLIATVEANIKPSAVVPTINPRIAEIKQELSALDTKRIRPLAEGDAEFLAILNAQAVALREELSLL